MWTKGEKPPRTAEDRSRQMIVPISKGIFTEIVSRISVEGLPKDAEFLAWDLDFETEALKLKFRSMEFGVVPECAFIPLREVIISPKWKVTIKKVK